MRTYVAVTGVLLALVVVMHVLRAMAEGPRVLREPVFAVATIAAAFS